MKISFATTEEERTSVYRLRYAIYVNEMNRPQRYADHSARIIEDPLDSSGHVLLAKDNEVLVGTLRINFLREAGVGEYTDLYRLTGLSADKIMTTSITTRGMIIAKYRSGTLAVKLAKAVYTFALENGIETDYLDCNPPLDKFFVRLGYRTTHQVNHPEYGNVKVMKLDLQDQFHLQEIHSPFLQILQKHILAKGNYKNVYSRS